MWLPASANRAALVAKCNGRLPDREGGERWAWRVFAVAKPLARSEGTGDAPALASPRREDPNHFQPRSPHRGPPGLLRPPERP